MRILVINNLSSGYREGAIYDFIRSFAADGEEIVIRSTDGTTRFSSLLHNADEFDLVVASGGDGTVASICYHLANSGIPILPFPAGTANLLTLNLLSPNEPHALANLARDGKILSFDLGEIEFQNDNGDFERHGFGIMAGAGYDALIMDGAQPNKLVWGPLAYFTAALANPTPQRSTFTITLDGETIHSEGIGILVMNLSKIQFDISLTHENKPRDGMLDIMILKAQKATDLLPAIGAAFLDRSGGNPGRTDNIETYQAKTVTVSADPPMEIQFDGEVTHALTPFTARVIPDATRLVISDEGYEYFTYSE